MQKKAKKQYKKTNFDVLKQVQPNAAGIDVGAEEMYVCVPTGRAEERVRIFGTFTPNLEQLADWLEACDIESVAMESTSIYWMPLYDILEGRGIEVCLVNARHIKNVTGRKTDVSDCEWIYQLHTYGLLQDSFHPTDKIRALRALARHRGMLVGYRASHIQHMQKSLELMNLKLTYVLSDITGVTGLKIIRAIIAGQHSPKVLATYRDGRCKHSIEEIEQALTGNYRHEHLFSLQQAVELYDMYGEKISAVDAQMAQLYEKLKSTDEHDTSPPKATRRKARKNQPAYDLTSKLYRMAGVDLTQIDGIDNLTAQTILTEIGPDVTAWRTEKHFASWLGLSPNNRITGGKVKRRGTKKVGNRVSTALRIAAQSLARSQSALGAFYRRIKLRHGAPKAIVATAHRLARIIYAMLKNKTDYHDPGATEYEKLQREKSIKRLKKQAKRLGLELAIATPSPV